MNQGKIAVRYAKAIYQLAEKHQLVDKMKTDFHMVIDLLNQSADLHHALMSPVIGNQTKARIINGVFENKINPFMLSFLLLLNKNNRESLIKDIYRDYCDIYREKNKIVPATIISAYKLNDNETERIAYIIKTAFNSQVEFHNEIKPALIGGFILKIGDRQIDNSLSGGINRLKQKLTKTEFYKKQ